MTAAAASMTARTAGRLGSWLSMRHSLRTEAATLLALYGLYEVARGLLVGDAAEADRHAHRLVALERSLHLFLEAHVQRASNAFPGLTSLLGIAYLTLHLAVTAGALLWLHRRRPAAFPFASLLQYGRRRLIRALGALYPPFVLLVIVATGNHFFFDAATGALVAGLAATTSALITRPAATGRVTARPAQCNPLPPLEELAA